MRYLAKPFGLFVATALLLSVAQHPGFSKELLVSQAQKSGFPLSQNKNAAVEKKQQADRLFSDALQLWRTGQYPSAREALHQALDLYQSIEVSSAFPWESRQGEADTLTGLGSIANSLGQYQEALSHYEVALNIQRTIEDRAGEGNTLNNIGTVYDNLAQYEQALNVYQDALVIRQEEFDPEGTGQTLNNIGVVYVNLAQYKQALDIHQDALALFREIDDSKAIGITLTNIGVVYHYLNEYERSLRVYQDAFALFQEIEDPASMRAILGNMGSIYRALGQYSQTLNVYSEALAIAQEIGDLKGEGLTLKSIGLVHHTLGQDEQALKFYQAALTIVQKIGDRKEEGSVFHNMGLAYYSLGDYERSIDYYQNALAIAQEIGNRRGEGIMLTGIGLTYYGLGDYGQSVDYYHDALAIAQEISDRNIEGISLNNFASTYEQLGEYEKALSLYQDAVAIAQDIGNPGLEATYLSNQGAALASAGQFSQAETKLHQAVEIYESLRTELSDHQLISIIDTQTKAYARLETTLINQGKIAEALEISERGRGRAFALQLAGHLTAPIEPATLADDSLTEPVSVADIQQIARNTQTTLVTYSIVEDRSLHIWVVQPSGNIEFKAVKFGNPDSSGLTINPISDLDDPIYRSSKDTSELTSLVADSRATILVTGNNLAPDQLKALYEVLIAPIADLLPTNPDEKVAFIPQSNLFLVPFAALQDDTGTHLIEKHTILSAPSIQVFNLANEVAQRSGVRGQGTLVVGNPVMPTLWSSFDNGDVTETQLSELPGAKTEAEEIAALLNVTPLTGEQATETRIKQQLPTAHIVHLATHGLLDYGDPRAYGTVDIPGAVALTPGNGEDGLLTSAEILAMELQADLVVLSACDTGRGRITGDGVVGLSRALITAGTPSVVVSLWQVPDAPTAELMAEFYRQLTQGLDKAQALRQAMLTTMKTHPNPRDWAAFTLLGSSL